jgi:hypothetical protein
MIQFVSVGTPRLTARAAVHDKSKFDCNAGYANYGWCTGG